MPSFVCINRDGVAHSVRAVVPGLMVAGTLATTSTSSSSSGGGGGGALCLLFICSVILLLSALRIS